MIYLVKNAIFDQKISQTEMQIKYRLNIELLRTLNESDKLK
jgi:hypothetical protein